MTNSEILKLNHHINLLRDEYLKIHNKYQELIVSSQIKIEENDDGNSKSDTFATRIMQCVGNLFNSSLYSDISVIFSNGNIIYGHKFVLKARNEGKWYDKNLDSAHELELKHIPYETGLCIFKWIYTNEIEMKKDVPHTLQIMKYSTELNLLTLKDRCQYFVIPLITSDNCIEVYEKAIEYDAGHLKNYSLQIISNYWDEFDHKDFTRIPAPLMYDLVKLHSKFALHQAINLHREDVVLLFLVDNDSRIPQILNQVDSKGEVPLNLALKTDQKILADTLIKYKADLNVHDLDGIPLLHTALERRDQESALFLLDRGADPNVMDKGTRRTALHLLATYRHDNSIGSVITATSIKKDKRHRDKILNGGHSTRQPSINHSPTHRGLKGDHNQYLKDSPDKMILEDLIDFGITASPIRSHPGLDLLDGQSSPSLPIGTATILDTFEDGDIFDDLLSQCHQSSDTNKLDGDSLTSKEDKGGTVPLQNGTLHDALPISTFDVCVLMRRLLDKGADVNAVDVDGKTALQLAIEGGNSIAFEILLNDPKLELPNTRDKDGHSPLWAALTHENDPSFKMVDQLISRGAPYYDVMNPVNGIPLLNELLLAGQEDAAIYLIKKGGMNLECCDNDGTRPLHLIAIKGSVRTGQTLIQGYGNHLNYNAKIKSSGQTAGHLTIIHSENIVLDMLLDHKSKYSLETLHEHELDLNVKDYDDQTALSLALQSQRYEVATKLIFGGADVNLVYRDGNTLLEKSMLEKDEGTAIYLLENGANYTASNHNNPSKISDSLLSNCSHLMELAIKQGLLGVVKALCQLGVNLNVDLGDDVICPLWYALSLGKLDIASLLVQYGCDTTFWCKGPEGCQQTLLHKAIDENKEDVSCFLVRSNCEIDCPRRPGIDGRGGEESRDMQTPLHLACAWGLEDLVACLLEHNADVNKLDWENKSPLHVAIENQHHNIISLLLSHPFINLTLKDKKGGTPFETAMNLKNHKAAQSILSREPSAAEQIDSKGFNFLHLSIKCANMENVLFLIGVKANVNSRVQDYLQNTPLHLAMDSSEIIIRNLILAGSDVNAKNTNLQSPLHLAITNGKVDYARILLDNGTDYEAKDNNGNNALHIAVINGRADCVKMLLTETDVNTDTVNFRGRNALNLIGIHVNDNGAMIFDIFHQSRDNLSLNATDAEGNTALLHAYLNGRGNLCRSIVKAGASLGIANQEGISIFNAQVASNQLLFRLLDMLTEEPAWTESDSCNECGTKFGITMRKHHCRHCGRVLCTKCSDKVIPIVKFNLPKPVRVCSTCYEVLTSRNQL